MRYSLKVPLFQILIGGVDISKAIVGYSFSHPLSEISTPLIWTGSIEMFPARSDQPRSFFDDEINPSRWLSGLQPIDVYFNGTWWQRFRIKPSGYRFNQDNGQAEIEITDIIGILDSYQPSADAPEFKTGQDNRWNDLAVKLINKQAKLMGISVSVETPSYGIGGIYKVPISINGSYIKDAQRRAGERGSWMWSDKETIKWAEYPQAAQNIVWSKSRSELLTFTRQQGLEPVKQQVTVSATHEDIDTCSQVFPHTAYTYATAAISINSTSGIGQKYKVLQAIEVRDKTIAQDSIYTLTKKITGNPMLTLFGGTISAQGVLIGQPPEAKGYKTTKLNAFGGFAFLFSYTKAGATFTLGWTDFKIVLDEKDVTTYENIPIDSQNPSKILSRVVTRSEPWAKYPDGLQYFSVSDWFAVNVNSEYRITERVTTTYEYIEIKRDDIIVQIGQKLYEVSKITELKETVYFRKNPANTFPAIAVQLIPSEKTVTTYTKQCQGRWKEVKESYQNKGQSTTSQGYLFGGVTSEEDVSSIPEITYRSAPYPVFQRPLLATVQTGYAGVSPFVNSSEFVSASTLTTKAECEKLARDEGLKIWQRSYGRELASGFGTTLNYVPFQGVLAGNGAYIRDRFGISLNQDGDEWQFVEACIGNKTGAIAEIAPPPLPYPPILSTALNIGASSTLNLVQGVAIASNTFYSSGGQAPYTYSSTTLPTGLTLSSIGVLSGTPTEIATTSVTVTVTDSLNLTNSTTFNVVIVGAIVPISIVSRTIEIAVELNEVYSFSIMGGIPIPIVGIYEDLTVFSFAVSNANVSALIVPAIALTTLIGKVKPVNSDLVVTTPSVSTNVSTIKFANSDLVVNPVGSSANISDIKLASSALQVSSVAIAAQVSPVSLVASNLVIPPVSFEALPSTQLWTLSAITTQLWLDAADSATITTVSGGVSQWNDKSGNGRNATQSTSGSRPLLDTLNGLSVLSFDGTNDCLDLNRGFFVDNNYSLFVVATPDIGTEGYLLELCNNDETKQNIIITQYASKAYEYLAIDGSLVRFTLGSPSLTGFNILSYTINGTSVDGYANGSISGSGTVTTFAFEFRKLASSLFANYAQSKIAEIIVANVSTANVRQRIEGYLAHKWGLTANLPSGHPYKTTPPYV